MKTILVLVVIAAVSYYAWNHYFSRTAKIERAYSACIGKLNAAASQVTKDINVKTPSGNDPSDALAKGMGDAMSSMVQGMTSAMGGAMCGMIRDTCRQDFNGPVCQAALTSNR